jgi:hypothetical protein
MDNESRRTFCKAIVLSPFLASSLLSLELNSLQNVFHVTMNGELDDDLFIVKSTQKYTNMTHCFQMHNPKNLFNYNGKAVVSTPIYGMIEYDEKLYATKNELTLFFVANEREEVFNLPKLRERTHFKAVDLFVNKKVLIPSLLPEKNDVPEYPTWFGSESEEGFCTLDLKGGPKDNSVFNYYKLWENAVCGVGILIPSSSFVEIFLFNESGERLFTFNEYISTEPKNLISNEIKSKKFDSHIFTEVDGNIYSQFEVKTNDAYIMKNAITKVVIKYNNQYYDIPMPYPVPYPNRFYAMSLN